MRTILLVEDEEVLRDTYEMIISTQPCALDITSNGKEALTECEKQQYDLILVDLMMPVMSGVEFLEQFMPTKPDKTHVIVLSNLSSGKDYERALELGVDKIVLKANTTPKELISTIQYQLESSASF